jgi:hypothetical protein
VPVSSYEWVDEVEAMTVSFIRGMDLRRAGDLLHFDWQTQRRATFDQAEQHQDYDRASFAVQAEQVDAWLVLIEPNGYLSSLPESLSALSDADVAISVYWNVNAQMRFGMFADGVLVRSFDPLLPDLGPSGRPLDEETGLTFGVDGERPNVAALILAQRLTGVTIEREWLLDQLRETWTATGFPNSD